MASGIPEVEGEKIFPGFIGEINASNLQSLKVAVEATRKGLCLRDP